MPYAAHVISRVLLILLLGGVPYLGMAQSQSNPTRDSLRQAISLAGSDTKLRLEALYNFCNGIRDYDLRLSYADSGLILARELSAIDYQVDLLSNMGDSHMYLGNSPEAISHFLQALDLTPDLPEAAQLEKRGAILSSIGALYVKLENYPLAQRYTSEALSIHRRQGLPLYAAGDLTNLGEAYRLNKQYDSALFYFEDALTLFDSLGAEQFVAYAYGNIGLVKVALGEYTAGEEYIDEATNIMLKYNDGYGISAFKTPMGELYAQNGEWAKAANILEESLAVAKSFRLKEQIRDASKLLAEVLAQEGKFADAYALQQQYIAYNDTLKSEESANVVAELRADYTIEQNRLKNQLELDKANTERKLVGTLAWVLGVGFSSIGVLAMFLFVINRRKQHANILLEEQAERIRQKSDIIQTKNQEITSSIQYASMIQQAMLPYQERVSSVFPEHFVLLRPRDIVSGDFYWMQEVGDDVLLVVADCTGHGVPGALMSMLGMSLLDELSVGQGIVDPGEILSGLHKEIMRQLKQETSLNSDGMDISIIRYQPKKKLVSFSGAKQNLVYIQNNAEGKPWLTQLKGERVFVGSDLNRSKPNFPVHTLHIDQPTTVYLYTDGYQDQFGGPENKKFRPTAFRNLLLEANQHPVSIQGKILDDTFQTWKANQQQLDDVLVVGFKIQ